MRHIIRFIVFGVLVALSMGASCRQETAQSVVNAFLTAIAETAGGEIGDSLVDPQTP